MANLSQLSVSVFIAGFIFGIFGWFVFKQGKNEANGRRMMLGLALMTYGILVPNPWANWAIGAALLWVNYYSPWMGGL